MAKAFAVEYANGHRVELTARQHAEARHQHNHEGTRFFLAGVEVSADDYYEACDQGHDAWLAKRLLTHKKVRVLHGSSVACYVTQWVRR